MNISITLRKIIPLGMAGVLIGGLLAPTVSAHTETFDSNVSIRLDGDVFKGAVSNSRGSCQRGRVVTVFKIRDGKDRRIGSDRTNRNGNWAVPTDPKPDRGRFFARARGREEGRYRHLHVCGSDRSVTINTRN